MVSAGYLLSLCGAPQKRPQKCYEPANGHALKEHCGPHTHTTYICYITCAWTVTDVSENQPSYSVSLFLHINRL